MKYRLIVLFLLIWSFLQCQTFHICDGLNGFDITNMKYADGTLTFNRGDTLNFVDINDIYNWKEIVFPLEMGLTEMIFINDDTIKFSF